MPRSKQQWKPSDGAADRHTFLVPPKTRKAIIIKYPREQQLQTACVAHQHRVINAAQTTQDRASLELPGLSSPKIETVPHIRAATIVGEARPALPVHQKGSDLENQGSTLRTGNGPDAKSDTISVDILHLKHGDGNDRSATLRNLSGQESTPPSASSRAMSTSNLAIFSETPIRSRLDIYAYKYVPYWLRAVNESPAVPIIGPPLKRIDYDAYRSSFAAPRFQIPLPEAILPPTEPCHLYTTTLQQQTYGPFWKERVHNEYAAQHFQNLSFGLYNHEIREHDKRQCLYQIKVPGVREYNPRIDLGDVLLIRPLIPILQGAIALQAQQWSQTRDTISPGFSGLEHHAVVWSIMRRDELVILKLGRVLDGPPRDLRCNVIIPSQLHKNSPAWRAIEITAGSLARSSGGAWMYSMLFPDINDVVLQTTLWNGVFTLSWFDQSLNIEQKKAVQAVMNNNYGVLPYLISGPPGTGKTKTLVEAAMQLATVRTNATVAPHLLVCAPSDAAADTLLVRLSTHLSPDDLFRLNNWTRLMSEVPGEVRSYCFIDETTNLYSLPSFEKLMSYRIVVTSCRDANMLLDAGLSNEGLTTMTSRLLQSVSPGAVAKTPFIHWTALLLDEAAQATEPESMIPLAVVKPASIPGIAEFAPQLIMAGDEHQLGPRLVSSATPRSRPNTSDVISTGDLLPSAPGLEVSLFQRLFERPVYASHPLSRHYGMPGLTSSMLPIPRPAFSNLIRNYRSHPAILTTSSHLFYADTLITERPNSSPQILSWPRWPSRHGTRWPVMFIQNTSEDRVESVLEGDGTGAGSLVNFSEARIVLQLVQDLLSWAGRGGVGGGNINGFKIQTHMNDILHQDDIIIMSPFRAQVSQLRNLFRSHNLHSVRIGPLEAFQGLESRVVFLCTTRTRLGQHPSPPRKFVDEDRARGLGVIGEEKRFNVAMTRAKEGLIVVGSAECLGGVTMDRCWRAFLGFVRRNGLVIGELPGSVVGRNGAGDEGNGRGALERALIWAEGLGMDEDMNGEAERLQNRLGEAGGERERGENGVRFRLRGRMVDLDERMLEMRLNQQDEEMLRREEEDTFINDEQQHDENDNGDVNDDDDDDDTHGNNRDIGQ